MAILTLLQQETLLSHGFAPLKTGSYLDDGTFSTVLAVSDASGQLFAIKIVDKILILKHDKAKDILEEKSIHLKLNHPSIVKLLLTFQDDLTLYFVLELCVEGNLLKFKEKIKSDPSINLRKLSKQLISAVEYLHSQRIIHRDIKPENILIASGFELKLADFGSAYVLRSNQTADNKDDVNRFVGTPEYLAPEILKGRVKPDESAFALDWWAVGCTLYWLLTGGKVLFEAGTEYLVYKLIESGPSAASLKECCDLDGLLAEVIFGLLERNPEKRIKFVKEQLGSLLLEF